MIQPTLGERIAVLEEQNRTATPLHDRFLEDIADLKQGQTEIKTTLALLVTNGGRGRRAQAAVYGGGLSIVTVVGIIVVAVGKALGLV